MEKITTENLLAELMETCGFGRMIEEPIPVSGGLMHKMYKVVTERGTYAVKHLNPEIMKRREAAENFAKAEALERKLEREGFPIVPSLEFDGKKMLEICGNNFYVFEWQSGKITDPYGITGEMCRKVGEILGRMHALEAENIEPKEAESEKKNQSFAEDGWFRFEGYLAEAQKQGSRIAGILSGHRELLKTAQERLSKARQKLPAMRCISNDDMDPKNVMWNDGIPSVIDLECLDYGNPVKSVLTLALQWAGTAEERFEKSRLIAFFEGYLSVYDNGYRSYEDLYGTVYEWLDWLEYNIRRALGMEGGPGEAELGEQEVDRTIGRIRYLADRETEICDALKYELPPVRPERYDNHDDGLVYYELFFERRLTQLPVYELPEGYHMVPYRSGNEKEWIEIELSAKELQSREQGKTVWERYYGGKEELLGERMFFIEDDAGRKVATATAYYDIYGRDMSGDAWLHWVAVRRQWQGKGLSKPLIVSVLRKMKELGYTGVKIPTQTNTWVACRIYHDLGFRPVKESLTESRAGWKMLEALTGKCFLRESDEAVLN